MAVGTNDAAVNRANGTYMKTNSADTRAQRPNSDRAIGSFMIIVHPFYYSTSGGAGEIFLLVI